MNPMDEIKLALKTGEGLTLKSYEIIQYLYGRVIEQEREIKELKQERTV